MRNRKDSVGAKAAAWVGITLGAVVFFAGSAGVLLMDQAGVYEMSREQFLTKSYQSVADQYAIRALDYSVNMENGAKPENNRWNDTYFRYGIIEAENIDSVDLNESYTYVERNFDEKVTRDKLYCKSYDINEVTRYNYSMTLWGGYSLYTDGGDYAAQVDIEKRCYNADDGIFYYETPDAYIPVKHVSILMLSPDLATGYDYTYDADVGKYLDLHAYSGTYVTFDDADSLSENTGFQTVDWTNSVILDGVTCGELVGIPVTVIGNSDLEQKGSDARTTYQLTDGMLQMNYTAESLHRKYWVVTILPENVPLGWSDDLFVQVTTLTALMYGVRYAIFPILAAAFVLTVFCLVWLVRSAGHHAGEDGITLTWLDGMPLDVYLGFTLVAEGFLFLILMEAVNGRNAAVPMLVGVLFCLIAGGWIALLSLLTFAARVKAGAWWKNTVIYMALGVIGRLCGAVTLNVPLFLRAVLVFGIAMMAEALAGTLHTGSSMGAGWRFVKVVEFACIFWGVLQMKRLAEGGERLAEGDMEHPVDTTHMYRDLKEHGEHLNSIQTGMAKAVAESVKSERFKTELITNVSHDIKTPLTSIINYVDLIKRQHIEDPTVQKYLEVLDQKSQRLKTLTEDLVEASRASSGNIKLEITNIDFVELVQQTPGEFEEKYAIRHLEIVNTLPNEVIMIEADGRRLWRVLENLYNNAFKYALEGTRVYVTIEDHGADVVFTIKNVSANPLNISPDELTERFVRGDVSRTTEGSGLGLSIAKDLTTLQGGKFELIIDGDLFKAQITFPIKN